jgi:hypothetical protein
MAPARVGALERPGLEHVGMLGLQALFDEQPQALGKAVGAFFSERL